MTSPQMSFASPAPRVTVVSSITPPDYAGDGLSAYKLASRLLGRGQLSFLVTRSTKSGRKSRRYRELRGLPELPADRVARVAPKRFREGTAEERHGPREWLSTALNLAHLAATTAWLLFRRRNDYDVLHCFTANWLSFFTICCGAVLGKPTILELTLLGRDDPGAPHAGDLLGIKSIMKRIQFRLVDAIVCLSPALVQRCAAAGIPPRKVRLVPRPVDSTRFRPARSDEAEKLVNELDLAGRWPILLFVGGISTRKGADLLLPTLEIVSRQHPDALLLIVGSADDKALQERLREEIERFGLQSAVRFSERTGRIDELMRAATVFILPSRREGFANVIVEAMASGLPVVVGLIPGITNFIVKDSHDGFVVPQDDFATCAQRVLQLIGDDQLRHRIGAAAVRTVRHRFGTEMVDSAYQKLYRGLLGEIALAVPRVTNPKADEENGGDSRLASTLGSRGVSFGPPMQTSAPAPARSSEPHQPGFVA